MFNYVHFLNYYFIFRQNEIQRLKEALILQNQKRDDLNKYKDYVHSEYQENSVCTAVKNYYLKLYIDIYKFV